MYIVTIGVRAADRKVEVDIGDKARDIKDKFEKGEVYHKDDEREDIHFNEDSAVFEQGTLNLFRFYFCICFIPNILVVPVQVLGRNPVRSSWKWTRK